LLDVLDRLDLPADPDPERLVTAAQRLANLVPFLPDVTDVEQPKVPYATYDPRGEGETSDPDPDPDR
jgi:hypothetical protein